jgi:hypothetical protein
MEVGFMLGHITSVSCPFLLLQQSLRPYFPGRLYNLPSQGLPVKKHITTVRDFGDLSFQ